MKSALIWKGTAVCEVEKGAESPRAAARPATTNARENFKCVSWESPRVKTSRHAMQQPIFFSGERQEGPWVQRRWSYSPPGTSALLGHEDERLMEEILQEDEEKARMSLSRAGRALIGNLPDMGGYQADDDATNIPRSEIKVISTHRSIDVELHDCEKIVLEGKEEGEQEDLDDALKVMTLPVERLHICCAFWLSEACVCSVNTFELGVISAQPIPAYLNFLADSWTVQVC